MLTLRLREASRALPTDPRSVAVARDFARVALTKWGLDDLIDDVTLVLAELVTNALLHATPPIQVRLLAAGRALRGEVIDHSTARPLPRAVDLDQEHGRGLALVEAYTSRWGVELLPGGKSVWCLWRVTS